MPFPKTLDELRSANYIFENYGECRGCGEPIDWYTTPRGKKMPFNHMDAGTDAAITHFSTCPEADSFRKRD